MNYQVGQILYICNESKMRIFPIQVVEEVIRTTLNGKEKTYIVMLPDAEQTKFGIEKVKDTLFVSLEDIQSHMINNATVAINNMALNASKIQEAAFNVKSLNAPSISVVEDVVQKNNNVQVDNNNDIIMVDLGGGVKAKMNSKSLNKVIG
jgi:hypothetical protein